MSDDYPDDFIIEESTTRELIQEDIELALKTADLSAKEEEIIKFKFGLPRNDFKSYEIVCLQFNIDAQSIRKIEEVVFREIQKQVSKQKK